MSSWETSVRSIYKLKTPRKDETEKNYSSNIGILGVWAELWEFGSEGREMWFFWREGHLPSNVKNTLRMSSSLLLLLKPVLGHSQERQILGFNKLGSVPHCLIFPQELFLRRKTWVLVDIGRDFRNKLSGEAFQGSWQICSHFCSFLNSFLTVYSPPPGNLPVLSTLPLLLLLGRLNQMVKPCKWGDVWKSTQHSGLHVRGAYRAGSLRSLPEEQQGTVPKGKGQHGH